VALLQELLVIRRQQQFSGGQGASRLRSAEDRSTNAPHITCCLTMARESVQVIDGPWRRTY
jgi:hypothetical protein